ncbi:acyl-CoA dehydrogenase family protein [Rhodopirellula sallentina]|uniref:CoA dehydrogenase family protein n=1 Tax=Rhodopirellula sallentina SM41 TaxID=1263870 RepID=M5UA58_9BACT|nr:acyl-CoA dehydrogenase family protein [Rhodopirellula sallentina]EMI58317.1 CoA dehydrogenase family protein [Rhodopirellula sallentina SM41]
MSLTQSESQNRTGLSEVSFQDFQLEQFVDELGQNARLRASHDVWPATTWEQCMQAGVPRWFAPASKGDTVIGGWDWSPAERLKGLMGIASADLTTAFVLTQFVAAISRMVNSDNTLLHEQVLPELMTGDQFATVGISHLATSRQHLARPVLRAEPVQGGWNGKLDSYILNGVAPWVTGVSVADVVVVGAVCDDGREMIFAVPVDLPGIEYGDGAPLVALSGSGTDQLEFNQVTIGSEWIVSGPSEPAHRSQSNGKPSTGTGSLQTSALAIGLSRSAIGYLRSNCDERPNLLGPTDAFETELRQLEGHVLAAADGTASEDVMQIRNAANDLVIRSTQAALVAAKGAGYVHQHHVGRWCREALFFLVWSCPQELTMSRVCELSGMAS